MQLQIERVRADIDRLCVSSRHSGENTEAHSVASDFIAESLASSGCEVDRQSFTVPSEPQPRPGLNVIGTLQPNNGMNSSSGSTTPSSILVGAHYDTVHGSPGADDNASGVAVMLECARVLSELERRRPVIFAAFDAEERQPEVGLHGSTAYVRDLIEHGSGTKSISAAYILEMVGYSAPASGQKVPLGLQLAFPRAFDRLANAKFAGDSVIAISNWKSRSAGRAFEEAARQAEDGVSVLAMEIPRWMPVPHNLKRSDHAPFWEGGIPAVMIGDTANFRNPNYHTPTDTPDTLDYDLIGRVGRTVVQLAATHVTRQEPRRTPRVKLR